MEYTLLIKILRLLKIYIYVLKRFEVKLQNAKKKKKWEKALHSEQQLKWNSLIKSLKPQL